MSVTSQDEIACSPFAGCLVMTEADEQGMMVGQAMGMGRSWIQSLGQAKKSNIGCGICVLAQVLFHRRCRQICCHSVLGIHAV
jgi:hypothetical protein